MTKGLDGFQEKFLEIQMLSPNPPKPWFRHIFTKSTGRALVLLVSEIGMLTLGVVPGKRGMLMSRWLIFLK